MALEGLLGGDRHPPLSLRKPERVESYGKKWDPIIPLLERRGIPRNVWGPIAEIDLQRVHRGQNVLSAQQTILAIRAAMERDSQVSPPQPGNIGQRFMRDMRQVVSAVPQMPGLLLNEAREAPKALTEVPAAVASGDLERLSMSPVVRMLPGAYLAENIATGQSPLEHPGFSLLDITPFLSRGVAKIPKVADARKEMISQGKIWQASPLRTAAREYIKKPWIAKHEARTGRPYKGLATRLGVSPQRQGTLARHSAQTSRVADEVLKGFYDEVDALAVKHKITKERQPIITEAVQYDRLGELRPNEIMYLEGMTKTIDRLAQEGFDVFKETQGKRGLWQDPATGEIYQSGTKKMRTMLRAREEAAKQQQRFDRTSAKIDDISKGIGIVGDRMGRVTGPDGMFVSRSGRIATDLDAIHAQIEQIARAQDLTQPQAIVEMYRLQAEQLRGKVDEVVGGEMRQAMATELARPLDPMFGTRVSRSGPTPIPVRRNRVFNALFRNKEAVAPKIVNAVEKGRFKTASKMLDRTLTKVRQEIGEAHRVGNAHMKTGEPLHPIMVSALKELRQVEADLVRWAKEIDEVGTYINDSKMMARKQADIAKLEGSRIEAVQRRDAAKATSQEILERMVPARWEPLVREQAFRDLKHRLTTDESLREKMAKQGVDADMIDWAEVSIRMDEGMATIFPGLNKTASKSLAREVSASIREARKSWLEIKAQGLNPVFVHAIDLDQAVSVAAPIKPLAKAERTPTQFRSRTVDPKPAIRSMELAVKHQGREIIQRIADEGFRDWITRESGWVSNGADLFNQYEAVARRMIDDGAPLPPGVTAGNLVDHLVNADWTAWNPKSLTPLGKGHFVRNNLESMYVPKWVEKTMNDMFPTQTTKIGGVIDKANNVFRTSILPLSPRWHVNNFIGGATMLLAKGGPGVLRHFGEARRLIKSGELPMEISRGAGSMPAADAAWAMASGNELAKILDWEQKRKARNVAEKVGEKITDTANVSYAMGEYVDTFYRALAYLEGKSKADRMGLGRTEGRTAGIELANKILQDWDAMTPVERQVFRMAMPFYGWIKHIIGFTVQLPFDHPHRVAIWSNFARNEWEDWGTGIPERFMQVLTIGKPDEWGTIQAKSPIQGEWNPLNWQGGFNMRGANPFSDTANYMTLAGFAGQLSPVAGGLLEAAGINPATGKAGLYNETIYDEVLGRQVPIGPESPIPGMPGAAWSIVKNITPQLEFATHAVGLTSNDLRRLKIQDPHAFDQRLLSSLGIPFVPRDINLHREAALAEVSRNQAAMEALNTALRTGDWSYGDRYPEVKRLLDILRSRPQSEIAPFLLGQQPKFARLAG